MAMNKSFKPEQGSSGKYTLSGLKSGEKVKVRVLTDWIDGKSVWSDLENGKRSPFRVRSNEPIPVGKIGVNQITQAPERIKQFIAAVVWNYKTEQVEILETDKSTIIDLIYDLEQSEDWGDSKGYDITISKTGTGMDTKYSVLPSGQGVFKLKADFESVNLEALYDGTDPFSTETQQAIQNKTDKQVAENIYSEEAEIVADDVPF